MTSASEELLTNGMVITGTYPLPANEQERLEALQSYHILDTAGEKEFDDLTQLASAICQTPVALITLVDKDRQWFKSKTGIDISETPKEYSFCAHAITSPKQTLIVKNAHQDERFASNPFVKGEMNLTFYAGVPLVNEEGFALGTLCVIDSQPRVLTDVQLNALMVLAKQVVDKLELRRKMMELQVANTRLIATNKSLEAANKRVHATEERFRTLVSQAPAALATLRGRNLVIEMANESILKIWGKDSSIIGKPLSVALPELQGNPYLDFLDHVFTSGETFYGYEAKAEIHEESFKKEGFFNFIYQPLTCNNGEIESILVVATEITEQVQAKKELIEINHRLEIALDAAKMGSYDLDLHTGKMECTAQCKANFGLPKDTHFHLRHLFKAIIPEHRTYVKNQIDEAVKNHTTYNAEYQITWPEGCTKWIAAYGKPLYDEQDKPVRIIGVTYDITDRKMLEQHKDDFLSIASHELKTPITSLKSALQLLDHLKDRPFTPTSSRLIELANKSVHRITTLVDQLLDINRIYHDQLALNKTTFVIGNLLNDCCQHVRSSFGKHEIIFEGNTNLKVHADEDRIDQVVINFINNAVKYAPDSPNISILVEQQENMARITIKDNGPGISTEQQKHIFERYYRASHTSTTYSGLGLGLYICAEIIKKHCGQIGVVSTEGKGSSFWFTLPLADEQETISSK